MKVIPEIVKKQGENRIAGYVQNTGKTRELAEVELIDLSFMRLKIDMNGKRFEYPDIQLSNRKDKISILKSLRKENWKLQEKKHRIFGEVYEETVLLKTRYYLKHSIQNIIACIITEDIPMEIPSFFDKEFYETSILCSWILPYWTEVYVFTFEKENKRIRLCLL